MADADETEATAGADIQDSEMTRPGTRSTKLLRKKVKASRSAGTAEPTSSGVTKDGSSTACGKDKDQTKLPKPKLDLHALFDYHFTRKQYRCCKRWNIRFSDSNSDAEPVPKRARRPGGRRRVSRGKSKLRERGHQFPFVEKQYGRKHFPMKMVRRYEHAALKGFFKYVEMLKYEHHLKKSLMQLDAGDELENECLESRKHKYVDDDGPVSPIAEPKDEDSADEDIGARVVDNSCFILSSRIPEKKKPKVKQRSRVSSRSRSTRRAKNKRR